MFHLFSSKRQIFTIETYINTRVFEGMSVFKLMNIVSKTFKSAFLVPPLCYPRNQSLDLLNKHICCCKQLDFSLITLKVLVPNKICVSNQTTNNKLWSISQLINTFTLMNSVLIGICHHFLIGLCEATEAADTQMKPAESWTESAT